MGVTDEELNYARRHRIRTMSELAIAVQNGDVAGESGETDRKSDDVHPIPPDLA